jgi:hypothetical protein
MARRVAGLTGPGLFMAYFSLSESAFIECGSPWSPGVAVRKLTLPPRL